MGRLEDKIILITGATSGIGEACAKLFAEEGAEVILIGRNDNRGIETKSDIENNGGKATFYSCDVTDEIQVINLHDQICERYDHVDVLFNNAGILDLKDLNGISLENWHNTFHSNTDSVMLMTKYFIDDIIRSKGNILNNASIDGLHSNVRGSKTYMYGSSKAAVIQFTQICALNYSDRIRVNCICPGVTKTPIFTNRDFSRFNSSIPMNRVAEPEEIAKAALFLVSDDASYITGEILNVDGGASLL